MAVCVPLRTLDQKRAMRPNFRRSADLRPVLEAAVCSSDLERQSSERAVRRNQLSVSRRSI